MNVHKNELILCLHGVGDPPEHVERDERPYWCGARQFCELIDAIAPISEATGVHVRLTFDDGNESDLRVAVPALVDQGIVAEFFVCAGRIGMPGYLTESDLVEIEDAGMRVGSHGWAHVDWRSLDEAGRRREHIDARARLSDILGRSVDEVAIPFGSYDRRVLTDLRRTGVRVAYTSDRGLNDGRGWLPQRETYTTSWEPRTLRDLSGRRTVRQQVRGTAARLAKRLR